MNQTRKLFDPKHKMTENIKHQENYNIWKRLFTDTVSVNKTHLTDTVSEEEKITLQIHAKLAKFKKAHPPDKP